MAFNYREYVESQNIKDLKKKAESVQAPSTYTSAYADRINALTDSINNRQPFNYDVNGDALYQQYKKQYTEQGQQAMKDTIGQASALTGGYANSYAATAGNQAYQSYLQRLNDVVPALYQLALNKYNSETTDMYNRLSMLNHAENTAYAKHRDTVGDYYTNRDYYQNLYNSERAYDYGKYSEGYQRAFANYQQATAEEQWQKNFAESQRQFDANLAESKRQYDETMAYNKSMNARTGGGSTGRTYSSGGTSTKSEPLYKQMGYKSQVQMDSDINRRSLLGDESFVTYLNGKDISNDDKLDLFFRYSVGEAQPEKLKASDHRAMLRIDNGLD